MSKTTRSEAAIADDQDAFSFIASAIKKESTASLPAHALTAKTIILMKQAIWKIR